MTIELQTERLILRPLAPEDFEPHAAMMAEERVARFLTPDRRPPSRANSWRGFAMMIGHWRMRGFGFFSAFEKATGAWAGRIGPWAPETWPGLECGWAVAPRFWGKGYAPEAAVATIKWIFAEKKELARIISLIDPLNMSSQAVAEKIGEAKSGETFDFDEHLRLDIWAATRAAFLQKWR
jgi:RimJ/RimL family protein N-acetyltransferase